MGKQWYQRWYHERLSQDGHAVRRCYRAVGGGAVSWVQLSEYGHCQLGAAFRIWSLSAGCSFPNMVTVSWVQLSEYGHCQLGAAGCRCPWMARAAAEACDVAESRRFRTRA